MPQHIILEEYDDLVRSIKRKRKWVIALTIVAIFLVVAFCSPVEITILEETVVLNKGISPVWIVIFAVLLLFFGAFAHAIVSLPLTNALEEECDPKKYLVLNIELNDEKNIDNVLAVGYFYLGDLKTALSYADKMILSKKTAILFSGLFNKARCEFFLNDFDALKSTVGRYNSLLENNTDKKNAIYHKFAKIMELMVAISEDDKEKITLLRDIEVWNAAKTTYGFVNYLKGVAAYCLDDKFEAIYRFMSAKENGSKTLLLSLCEDYLEKLK